MSTSASATAEAPLASQVDQSSTPGFEPWGAWATVGFTAIIAAAFLVVQYVVLMLLAAIELVGVGDADPRLLVEALAQSGFYLSIATCASTVVCTSLILLFIRLRRRGSATAYLGLTSPARSEWVGWLLAVLGLEAVFVGLAIAFERPDVPDFMLLAYATARSLPLLWFAVIVAAPVFEEALFRGFLFEGLQRSAAGRMGAIVLTALAWAGIHIQYDLFDLSSIFVLGLLLGVARARTGSLYLTIAMHALVNTLAMFNVALFSP